MKVILAGLSQLNNIIRMSTGNHNNKSRPTPPRGQPKTVPFNRVRIAGYTILREIGQGGMSVVYLAEQNALKREVAIKVLKKNVANDPEVASRFLHEAKLIAKLDHPNIVSIYEVGHTEDGDPYYSMPYLRFGDLSQTTFKFDKDIKHLMYGVCEGLAYSHEHDVVHRDLKPANILFDHFGNAQVADFGIALSRDSKRWTKEEHIIGSACYMSPEQALSKPVTQASDLYSLGTILYEQLTGKPPFVKDDDLSTLVAHINEPVPRLPPEKAHWQDVIDKALAKHPEDRFFNALEFKNAVRQVTPRFSQGLKNTFRHNQKLIVSLAGAGMIALGIKLFWPTPTGDTPPAPEIPAVSGSQAPVTTTDTLSPDTIPEHLEKLELAETATPSAMTSNTTAITLNAANHDTLSAEPARSGSLDQHSAQHTPSATDTPTAAAKNQLLTPAQATTLISAGFQKIKEKRLTLPADDNAFSYFTEVLESYPGNKRATQGIQLIFNYYIDQTRTALAAGNDKKAGQHAKKLHGLYQRSGLYSTSKTLRQELLETATERFQLHRRQYHYQAAQAVVDTLALALPDDTDTLRQLQTQADAIPRAGQLLRDENGADTVFIPGGTNGPGAFGLMPREVTVDEYARFAKATNRKPARCQHKAAFKPFSSKTWKKPPFKQTQNHPVVCVSWDDANAYAQWLSKKSGHHYSLPSSAQWLSLGRWQTSGKNSCEKGNVAGQETGELRVIGAPWPCQDKHVFTAQSGSFGHNPLGIGDIWGNVAEWLDGCAAEPKDADKKWIRKLKLLKDKGCPRHYAGNSWLDGKPGKPLQIRTALPGQAMTHIGFRLVRRLN